MKIKLFLNLFLLTTLISCSTNDTKQKTEVVKQEAGNSSDTPKIITNKKFKEADNTAVYTTKFVVIDHKEITEVHHDVEDGAWQFFSDDKFDDLTKVAKIVGLGQVTKTDSTLFEISDMKEGYVAYRKFKGDKWVIEKSN